MMTFIYTSFCHLFNFFFFLFLFWIICQNFELLFADTGGFPTLELTEPEFVFAQLVIYKKKKKNNIYTILNKKIIKEKSK